MRYKIALGMILTGAVLACADNAQTTAPPPPGASVLLKDIEIPTLPSPYYHFEYDTDGRVRFASFASGFTMYDVTYQDGRITELANNTAGNRDKLEYTYDKAGRVSEVSYVHPDGSIYVIVTLSYDGHQLRIMERKRKIDSTFLVEKTMSFSYYADGNLRDIVEHRPLIAGWQDETTRVDHFEQYDGKVNVDGFSLIHNEFFDHLVLLPQVELQKGNPGKETATGDGVNYQVAYAYTYDAQNRPLTKDGEVEITNGADAGQKFETHSTFSYY